MRFLWRDTLRRMTGSEGRCPICKTEGLLVTERNERDVLPDLRGIPYCECPRCGARGEFAELVARVSDRSTEDTVRELRRLGELEANGRDADTYCARKAAQAETEAHFAACVAKLRAAPHLGGIRAGLSVANLRQLPADTGLFERADAPKAFTLLTAKRYLRLDMTLYRYRFDGETTCFDAQNPRTHLREHRLRVTGDVGVYLGDFRPGEVPSVLVAAADPRVAGQAYGAWRAETSLPSPVIGVAGFPLPSRFAAVHTLYLLDTPDAPLPLEFALKALNGPLVYGGGREPLVKVLTPKCKSSDITAEDIRRLSNASPHGRRLEDWLQDRLLAMTERREEVANALLQAGADEACRARVAELLGPSAPKGLVDTVLLPTTEPDDLLALASGKLLRVTPVGLYTAYRVNRTGEILTKSLLCNVGLTVDARVTGPGGETAVCTVTHPDPDVAAVTVRIPRAHWASGELLAEDVRAAYAEGGRTPYVAFYHVGGYAWSDVMQLLGSRCPVQTGLRCLGATPEGEIHLPAFVAARKAASPQTKAGLVDPDALAAYSALTADCGPDDMDRLLAFIRTGVTLDRTGVAAGVLHALFCAAARQFDPSGVRRPPAHLLFVETETGVWDSVLRTLSYVFSGSEYVPLMDYADRSGFLKAWVGLGTLPLLTRLTSCDDIATVLAGSPVPVIAVADPLTALACSGKGTVAFVLPHVESDRGEPISAEEVEGLRKAFCAHVIDKAGTRWLDLGLGGAAASSTPVLSALGVLADDRDPKTVAGGLFRSVRSRYPGAGLTGMRAFFGVLHREILAQQNGDPSGINVTIVTGAPADAVEASFNDRGEHVFVTPDRVLVSKAVVGLINRDKKFLFDDEQLSREFEENAILLHDGPSAFGIDGTRVWAFPRTVWDAEVVRATGFAPNRKVRKETSR